jgi:hypothetical protein
LDSQGGEARAAARSVSSLVVFWLVGPIALAVAVGTAGGQVLPPASIADLLDKAIREGVLRVIVELKINPAGSPSPEAVARAQDAVLQELAPTGHRVSAASGRSPC